MNLPDYLKPYFSRLDHERDRRLVILQIINYGDFDHWRWLVRAYGRVAVCQTLEEALASEVRPQALRLATLLFGVQSTALSHAPRGTR